MGGDKSKQPPSTVVSCCYHPELKKWYPYDTTNGWDLTTECAGVPLDGGAADPA